MNIQQKHYMSQVFFFIFDKKGGINPPNYIVLEINTKSYVVVSWCTQKYFSIMS